MIPDQTPGPLSAWLLQHVPSGAVGAVLTAIAAYWLQWRASRRADKQDQRSATAGVIEALTIGLEAQRQEMARHRAEIAEMREEVEAARSAETACRQSLATLREHVAAMRVAMVAAGIPVPQPPAAE